MNSLNAISLFTGAGGMDVGFSQAGFNIVLANELDKDACDTYVKNHNGQIIHGDINEHIDKFSEYPSISVVFGGPPCQGFSVAGKMDPTDTRSQLIFSFMDVVEKTNANAFVLENVKALASLKKWSAVRQALYDRAEQLGFDYYTIVLLNATDFDVPQKRERMFFVGIRDADTLKVKEVGLEHYLDRYKKKANSVRNVFKSLGPAGTEQNPHTCNAKITLAKSPILRKSPYAGMLFNGAGRPINPQEYSNTLPASMGGNRTPIVDENQIFGDGKSWIEDYHDSVKSDKNKSIKEAPSFLRRITINEAALIQTFPPNYQFCGRQNSIYKQIGNAVPCNLAFAVASALKDALTHKQF